MKGFRWIFVLSLGLFACRKEEEAPSFQPSPIYVGFAYREIVNRENFSDLFESYEERNGNVYFDGCPDTPEGPAKKKYCLEPFIDKNGNGWFDGAFLAGFGSSRPARGVHDPVEVRVWVMEVGKEVAVFATLDAIGYHYSEVEKIQSILRGRGVVPYTLFVMSSTHDHEAPDTMGQWGPDISTDLDFPVTTGALPEYLDRIRTLTVSAIEEAYQKRSSATLCVTFASSLTNPLFSSYPSLATLYPSSRRDLIEGLENDWRDPFIINHTLTALRFTKKDDPGQTIGVVANIHSHAESLWDDNTLITADYPGFVRRRLEQRFPGAVGIHVSGTVGGIIGPHNVAVWERDEAGNRLTDPVTGLPKVAEDATFAKARSLGYEYGDLIADAFLSSGSQPFCVEEGVLTTSHKEFLMPIQNPAFVFGGFLRVFPRTIYDSTGSPLNTIGPELFQAMAGSYPREGIAYVRTAVGGAVLYGKDKAPILTIVSAPGEMFSEYAVGLPDDLNDPSKREFYWPQGREKHTSHYTLQFTLLDFVKTPFLFIYGLGNDELGYLVPDSDFIRYHPLLDNEPPDHYEESNSVGPLNEAILKKTYEDLFSRLSLLP